MAVVVEDRVDALLPLAALVDQRVTQPDPRAEIQQVIGRNPGLRQPADHQQLAQVAGVGAIGLGALLGAAPRARLGRLGQMHHGADRAQLLGQEPPTGCGLKRGLDPRPVKAMQKPSHALAVRGRDPRPPDLTGREGSTHELSSTTHVAVCATGTSGPPHRIPLATVGTSSSNGRPRGRNPRAP